MAERVEIITDKLGNKIIRGEGVIGTKTAERAHKRELAQGDTKFLEHLFAKLLPNWLIQFFLQIGPFSGASDE
jgi:hypothetical protein